MVYTNPILNNKISNSICNFYIKIHYNYTSYCRFGQDYFFKIKKTWGQTPVSAVIIFGENYILDKNIEGNYNISMEDIKFQWDENKNQINKKKHGVSFEEARTTFYDENAVMIADPEHSEEEERFTFR